MNLVERHFCVGDRFVLVPIEDSPGICKVELQRVSGVVLNLRLLLTSVDYKVYKIKNPDWRQINLFLDAALVYVYRATGPSTATRVIDEVEKEFVLKEG